MPAAESHPPAYNGQRAQHRPLEDGPIESFLPVSSGNFLLADAQGGFTLSAEPGMIEYGSIGGMPHSNTPGTEAVFTPNTASSFDNSLHPDSLNQAYQQQSNAYMHQSNYSLSPGTISHNGQSISPSHSLHEHINPEGYLSDQNFSEIGQFSATPSFDDHLINGQLGNQMQYNFEGINTNAFNTFHQDMQMSLPMTNESLATFNAQPPLSQASYPPAAHSESHLLSPIATNNSSPGIVESSPANTAFPGAQFTSHNYQLSSSPPGPTMRATPSKQQHSPALTNSPGGVAIANPQPRAPHLTSPIVRVEHYSNRGESPSRSDASRPVSKRSHGSRRSGNHLSPYPADDSSEEEGTQLEQVRIQPVAGRNEDGSWNGQAGLAPDDRDAMKDVYVPSLDDMTASREKADKNDKIQDWLTKSEVGSEVGDSNASGGFLKPFATRRRAKSTNDAHRQHLGSSFDLAVRTNFDQIDDSGIPGPGVYLDVRSEYDEYEDDDDELPESPPAEIDFNAHDEAENSYFPSIADENTVARPWNDSSVQPSASATHYQPPTSNAAMMRFRQRAKDVESASLAATLGSRRLSESDLGSIRNAAGVIKVAEPDPKKHKEGRQRRPTFLENILPKRTNSNLLKRKGTMPTQPSPDMLQDKPKEKEPAITKPKRIGSWGRPKSPRLDTNVASQGRDVAALSPGNLSATSGPWAQAKNAIRRSRSRSDLGKSPGLAELMTQHGGPPMPMLASPLAETEATKQSPIPSGADDEDDDGEKEAVTMDLTVRSDPIIPTYEGFKTHARQLNPRLVDFMVERITQEQMRRYKRLLEFRVKHLNAVKNRNCSSNKYCTALGGESKQLPPRAGNKDSDAPFIGFQITAPGSSDDDGEPPPEGTVVSAQFPSGVPLPPVKRLPAEFECPLCFKVKKFYKPSDWTKHVHEDVQPFTCTFPNCGEPKSFKRKADWVRHENERHRQLENWTCCIGDCNHTCYRKDNFVQHLVREHKIAEPRARTGRGGNSSSRDASANPDSAAWQGGFTGMPAKDSVDDIWTLVERCRRDTTKQPKDEPCRFCGNICNSWKKLTVHLAKHMEQISMPILPLVEQKQMNADTVISPVVEIPEHTRNLSSTPNRSPIDNPSRYNPNASTLAPGVGATYSQYSADNSPSGLTSSVMHTYPPPQIVNTQTTGWNFDGDVKPFTGRSYPGLQDPSKAMSAYASGLQIPSQPYHNGNIQNGPNRYPQGTAPISAMNQQPNSMFTSPVENSAYTTDTMGSTYYTQEPQAMSAGGAVPNMNYDYPYQSINYMAQQQQQQQQQQRQQQNYQFQGR